MKPACPRLFEAEALRDGRLVGAELTNFERHLGVCPHCSREVEALRALGDALRAVAPGPADVDELHVRRERTRLLAAFDAALVPPERTHRVRRVLLGFAAVAAIIVGLVVSLRPPALAPGEAATRGIIVRADSNASWSRRVDGSLEKILLERGALSIHVEPALALDHRRLLVVLPDGELEDIGTTFTVSADAGRTTRVSVQNGSVVLRLRGQPPLALGAGDTWTPPVAPSPSPCTSCVAAPPVAPSASSFPWPPERRGPAASARAPRATPAPPSPSLSPPAPAPDSAASRDFRAAMTAFDSGDNTTAAARFADFLGRHPRDARTEDAAYLRVIALQRANDTGSMREAAAQYLRRYPHGFRRAEVETLSR